jgi:hypothetical protein
MFCWELALQSSSIYKRTFEVCGGGVDAVRPLHLFSMIFIGQLHSIFEYGFLRSIIIRILLVTELVK